jgi:hypothetical protein
VRRPSAIACASSRRRHEQKGDEDENDKGIGFFPTILGQSVGDYLQDPAACPDATDKAFLPQGRQDGQPLRAGVCQTSTKVIHLHTLAVGEAGPEGWASTTTPSEPGWVTYYRVTDH